MTKDQPREYPNVFQISPEAAEHLYQFMWLFWEKRAGQDMDDGEVAELLRQHEIAMAEPPVAPIRDTVLSILQQVHANGVEFSILELGAANGSIVHVIDKEVGLDGVRYVGIEPWGPFIEDFRARFPGQTMIQANIDQAIDLSSDDFGTDSFCVFLASQVFCMVEPDRVRRYIKHLSGFCNCLIIQDTIINSQSQLSPNKVAIFPFKPWDMQFYFANPFEVLLNEFGYRIVSNWEMPPKQGKHGWSIFIATK
ncbi:MAG: hypothetical protein HQ512_12985 [Rhodospirillales bacterium]|nr:hypothetical protein [Rhodospirillales bacterium]